MNMNIREKMNINEEKDFFVYVAYRYMETV